MNDPFEHAADGCKVVPTKETRLDVSHSRGGNMQATTRNDTKQQEANEEQCISRNHRHHEHVESGSFNVPWLNVFEVVSSGSES